MAERISDTKPDGNERAGYKLELVGLATDERPSMAVQVLDAANAVLHSQRVQADGSFDRRVADRHRWIHRDPQSTLQCPPRLADRRPGQPRPGAHRQSTEGGRHATVLADVADVVEGTWPLFGDAVINGGDGLLLIVEKYPWANTLDVTDGVETALGEMRPGLPDIAIDSTIFRPATFIELALENLTRSLLLGCLLVVFVLALFLFEWRTALISLIAIPLSLMAGAIVLQMQGASINTMVLAGFVIAVGVVVDDAIIDVENIVRRLRQHRLDGSTRSTAATILDASLEVRSAIIYATLIDVATLLPVFFVGGRVGSVLRAARVRPTPWPCWRPCWSRSTVTPALCLILLANAPIERRVSPRGDVAPARLHRHC